MIKRAIFGSILALSTSVSGLSENLATAREQPLAGLGGTSTEANYLFDQLFIEEIDPARQMYSFTFDGSELAMGLRSFYFATYDYDKVTMAEADAGLEQLGTVEMPTWVKAISVYENNSSSYGYTTATVKANGKKDFFNNLTGVMYYAVEATSASDEDKTVWYRGKIDYHDCSYEPFTVPHIHHTCSFTRDIEQNKLIPERNNSYREEFQTWAEDLHEILKSKMDELEPEILSWTGTDERKTEILGILDDIIHVAVDATQTVQLQERANLLKTAFTSPIVEPDDDKNDNPENPGGNKEDDKDDNNQGNGDTNQGENQGNGSSSVDSPENEPSNSNPGTNSGANIAPVIPRPSISTGTTSGADTELDAAESGTLGSSVPNNSSQNGILTIITNAKPAQASVVIQNLATKTANSVPKTTQSVTNQPKQPTENDQQSVSRLDDEMEKDNADTAPEQTKNMIKTEDISVPSLSDEGSTEDNNSKTGIFWLIFLLIAALGMIAWWLKRAFGTKRGSKH